MKKALLAVALVGITVVAYAQYANCWQQYVCGGGGCQWVTICK